MNYFFSVVIPTYNPKQFLPTLLESISHNECIDKIEIILSDDCSEENFDDIIEQFKTLHIRKIKNDKHVGFPRVGRQRGADCAKGKWLCFSDQDDYFQDNAFDYVYEFIQRRKARNYIVSDFTEEVVETGERILRNRFKGWTHGKFYEKAFWDKYEIRYDDINYCEDINLTTKLDCICISEKTNPYELDKPVYVWRRRKDSLADIKYFADSMPDYVVAMFGVIIQYVEKYKDDEELLLAYNIKFISTFLHIYFYFQSNILNTRKQLLLKTVQITQSYYTKYKELTKFTNSDIIYYLNTELIDLYQQTRTDDYNQIPFIEQIAFSDWMYNYFE